MMKSYILFLLFLFPALLPAHDDPDEKKESRSADPSYFTSVAVSDKMELLARYNGLHTGEEKTFLLFLSDYRSNRAIDSAQFSIKAREDAAQKFEIRQIGKGCYEVKTLFTKEGLYNLTVQIQSRSGNDLLLLQNIRTNAEAQHEDGEASENKGSGNPLLLFGAGLLAGLAVMFLFMKLGQRKSNAMLLLAVFLSGMFPMNTELKAHDDHDDTKPKSLPAGGAFGVPKETQFLFEVLTQPIETGDFQEATSLYGTIIPSSNGMAQVNAAQSGRIVSLQAVVGQVVHKGDPLAVLEQALDASSQVAMLAEKNTLDAEYEAAKKEFDRLKQIADIASQRELSEAEARYQKAKENKELYNSSHGRQQVLRSPIDGLVGNFTYTIGSTVTAGDVLFSITNLSKVYVEAQVFDRDATKVAHGDRFVVECTNDDHKTAEVTVLAQAQTINPSNQSQRVLFEMKNPDSDFKIGEFVNIRVYSRSSSRQMALPNSAISEINGRPVVFIKDDAEHYSLRYISTGDNNGDYTVVLKGPEDGDRVVINGTYQLKMIYLNQ